jgi:hypothetical protein
MYDCIHTVDWNEFRNSLRFQYDLVPEPHRLKIQKKEEKKVEKFTNNQTTKTKSNNI